MQRLSGIVHGVRVHGLLPPTFAPYLSPASADASPLGDLAVAYRESAEPAPFAATWRSEPVPGEAEIRFALFPHPAGFGLAVDGEERGLFRCAPREVAIEWASAPEGAPHCFVTYALPLWLETRGVPVLHGSAVLFGGRAVGFLGASSVGKSTLAAELARLGCGFVADDGLALHRGDGGGWRCLAGPPLARLWPSGLRDRLGAAPEELPRARGGGEKRRWRPPGDPRPGAHPLAAVYLLERRADPGSVPRIGPRLEAKAALLRLLEHGVAAAPAAALGLSGPRLDRLAEVAETVPLHPLSFPGGGDTAGKILAAVSEMLGS